MPDADPHINGALRKFKEMVTEIETATAVKISTPEPKSSSHISHPMDPTTLFNKYLRNHGLQETFSTSHRTGETRRKKARIKGRI